MDQIIIVDNASNPKTHNLLERVVQKNKGNCEIIFNTMVLSQSLSQAPAHPWIEKAVTYYDHNEQRVDLARFRKLGYLIGSGTIESACRPIAAARLKRWGARWTLPGVIATARA